MLHRSAAWRVMTPRQALRVLSLPPSSNLTPASIKKAYIQQTLQCHPDLHPNNPDATENFRTLSDAFRVALKTLEAQRHGSGAAAATSVRNAEVDLYDPQAALESLRQAMLAYRAHQQSGGAPSAAPPSDSATESPFCTPTLEDVSSVCQREAVAMRRVQTFCAELPAVLCGSHSAALFEAVAFFHAHYVESMSACVIRFAQNLPLIVRRVVKQRRRYIDNGYPAVAQGIGTGTRPREQRLEDMAMKPLVLMGALIFDLPDGDATSGSGSSSSTCGVARPAGIRVCDELKCTIVPADSIADITAKLGRWEAASFDRLKLELAIVDAARLLSSMLGVQGGDGDGATTTAAAGHPYGSGVQLSVAPHLGESRAATVTVLRTLQKLAGDLCCDFDAALDSGAVADEAEHAMALHEASTAAASVQDDAAAAALDVPTLIAQCRRLAELARPTIRGNILLTWKATATADLVTEDAELARSATAPPKLDAEAASEARRRTDAGPPFLVGRHLTCSTAETLFYAVSVVLTKDLRTFLLRLRGALKQVVQATNHSKQVLFELLPLRECIAAEEFIRETISRGDGDDDETSETSPFRYRGPVQCFPRICNMDTTREHQLWKLLHAHREYLAKHALSMSPLNVFFECPPYDPAAPEMHPGAGSDAEHAVAVAGWVSGGSDGCDNVVVTAAQLDDAALFKEWLEEVVEQSALHREAEEMLAKAGVAYVSRDPALPLANYLSFVKVFVQSTAVRGVLERANSVVARSGGTATPHEVGLAIIVSPARCDVRDGGRLFLPWHVNPTILLALLGDTAAAPRLGA